DRGHLSPARPRGEFVLQEIPPDAPHGIEAVDVSAREQERVPFDECLPEIRGRGVVRPRPSAAGIREGHRGRVEEDDRRAGPPSEVLRVTDPHAADRGERRIRSDDRYPGTAASGGSVFNGSVEAPGEITLPCRRRTSK